MLKCTILTLYISINICIKHKSREHSGKIRGLNWEGKHWQSMLYLIFVMFVKI